MGILRLLLALTVVVAHSTAVFGISSVGGALAVQAFYIISGFYMSLILNEKYIGQNGSYRLFLSNRFLRLYPIYWVVLLLQAGYYLLGYAQGFAPEFLEQYRHTLAAGEMGIGAFLLLLATNVLLFFQDAIMFLGLNTQTGKLFFTPDFHATDPKLYTFLLIPQAWTVGIELLFYVVAPFLVRRNVLVVAALAVASIVLRVFIIKVYGYREDPWSYRFFPTELVFFLFGNFSYRLLKVIEKRTFPPVFFRVIYWILPLLTLGYQFIPLPSGPLKGIYFVLVIVLIPFLFQGTKKNKLDIFIGELSYPIYISHIFLIMLLGATAFKHGWVLESNGTTVVLAAILFALALNEWVAKPIERIRQGRVRKQPVAVTVAEATHPL